MDRTHEHEEHRHEARPGDDSPAGQEQREEAAIEELADELSGEMSAGDE